MKLPDMRMSLWTRSHEALRVQWSTLLRIWECLSRRWKNQSKPVLSGLLENCPGPRWSCSQHILAASLRMKLVARWVQDRSFTTTSVREPISQLVDNAFVFARREHLVHGSQLQLHRNKGDLQGSEFYYRQRPGKCHEIQGRVQSRRANTDVGSGETTRVCSH